MKPLLLLAAVLTLSACAGSNSSSSNGALPYGSSMGTVANINGIDIYQSEKPTKPYKVLRSIRDVRQDNLTPNDTILHALAQQARDAGGNAIIITSMKNDSTGGQVFSQTPNDPGAPSTARDSNNTITTADVIIYSKTGGIPIDRVSTPVNVPPPDTTAPMPPNSPL